MWPTIIGASVVGLIVILIYARQIRNKRIGKGCSCGGNCGACGMDCHSVSDESKE